MRRDKNLKPLEKFSIRQFREAGVSVREAAAYHNCSEATAYRALAELREKLGPEKLPKARRHFARSHLFLTSRGDNSQTNTAETHE